MLRNLRRLALWWICQITKRKPWDTPATRDGTLVKRIRGDVQENHARIADPRGCCALQGKM